MFQLVTSSYLSICNKLLTRHCHGDKLLVSRIIRFDENVIMKFFSILVLFFLSRNVVVGKMTRATFPPLTITQRTKTFSSSMAFNISPMYVDLFLLVG